MSLIDVQENIIWHRFSNGKTLVDLEKYKNIAMWWTIDEKFYEFLSMLITTKTKRKSLKTTHLILSRIFASRIGAYLFLLMDVFIFLALGLLYLILRPIRKATVKHDKPLLIAVTHDNNWRNYRSYKEKKIKKTDYFLEPMIPLLKKSANLLGIYPIQFFSKPVRSFKMFIDRVINWTEPYKPFQLYWTPRSWLAQRKILSQSKENVKIILNDKKFREKLIIEKTDYSSHILRELTYMFLYLLPMSVGFIETSFSLIHKEKPSVFVLINEYSLWERSVLIAAKIKNLPVVAIQHGEITETHRGYMYSRRAISPEFDFKSPYCPLPDKIAVYGVYYKKLLTEKSCFPKNSVVVTGQPRYDVIHFIKQRYKDINKIRKMFGVSTHKKILLWTTQTHGMSLEENRKNIQAVYSAVKDLPNIELVIKLHPSEDQNAHLYKQCTLIKPKIIGGHADTFLLLHVSDIVMTKTSTTALEAMLFDKPVIILNLSGLPDVVDYVAEGVAVGVYNENDLKEAILNILSEKINLDKNRKKYIEKKLYRFDDRASERVVSVLKYVLNQKRKNLRI
ncbi:MAG: CDP-glycerol glycerophosphotransferase family protein [Candidatus Odinarchaeota archaeon]|nr:CDP-glycerol glycerophosphotransferase family protein [Candidatus Odinarchaeota archaeon]